MKNKELQEILNFAVSILIRSGVISRRYFRSVLNVHNKSDSEYDPVTRADKEVEEFLRRKIRKQYPEHGIVGEEYGGEEGKRYIWVIDPIDGTRGYISGSPMWGSLLGLLREKQPILGVMHQPLLRETFFADTEGAWWKSGKQVKILRTRSVSNLNDAVLYCTHPTMFTTKAELRAFSFLEEKCSFSRFGADCYGYCLLAAGFVDLVVESNLQAHDIIPLVPIIKSAGGIVTDWEGKLPLNGGRVIAASNKVLHREALQLLNQSSN